MHHVYQVGVLEVLIYDNACRPADRFYWINIFSHDAILLFVLCRHLCCMSLPLCGVGALFLNNVVLFRVT